MMGMKYFLLILLIVECLGLCFALKFCDFDFQDLILLFAYSIFFQVYVQFLLDYCEISP